MATQNYYDILGVARSADFEVISAAYQILVRKYHPEAAHSSDAAQKLVLINQAYSVLSDPLQRADYDERLRTGDLGRLHGLSAPIEAAPSRRNSTPPAYTTSPKPKKKSSAWLWLISSIAALIAVAVFAYALLAASGGFSDSTADTPVQTAQNTPLDASQMNDVAPLQPIETEMPSQTAPITTPAQQAERDRAHGSYLTAVNAINATWNSLSSDTQAALRSEQLTINNRREAECIANARSQYSHPTEIETARYLCEVPRLDARNQQLQAYLDNQYEYTDSAETPNYQNADMNDAQKARASYDEAVANINSIWKSLPDDTRAALRDEQRTVNRDREARCREYAAFVGGSERKQRTTRYNCETPQLLERAGELLQYQ